VTLTSAVVGGTAAIVLLRPEGPLTALAGRALRAAAIAFGALILFRLLAEATIIEAGHLGWAKVWMLIPFIAIGYALDRAPRLLAAVGLLGTFAVHYSFIVTGQLVALGPKANWHGDVQSYAPNLPELLILVLGISVAAALIKLGERLFQDGVREI
jgi:hypothetical protein